MSRFIETGDEQRAKARAEQRITGDTQVRVVRTLTETQTISVEDIARMAGMEVDEVIEALAEGVEDFLNAYADSEFMNAADISDERWSGEVLSG